jgi:hypothetical protein
MRKVYLFKKAAATILAFSVVLHSGLLGVYAEDVEQNEEASDEVNVQIEVLKSKSDELFEELEKKLESISEHNTQEAARQEIKESTVNTAVVDEVSYLEKQLEEISKRNEALRLEQEEKENDLEQVEAARGSGIISSKYSCIQSSNTTDSGTKNNITAKKIYSVTVNNPFSDPDVAMVQYTIGNSSNAYFSVNGKKAEKYSEARNGSVTTVFYISAKNDNSLYNTVTSMYLKMNITYYDGTTATKYMYFDTYDGMSVSADSKVDINEYTIDGN